MLQRILIALTIAAAQGLGAQAQRVCNNAADLCNRKYNEITHLGAHDSPFVRNAKTGFNPFGNQYYDSITQLNAGVRLLTGQVHHNGQSWDLCHSICALMNAGSLSNWLGSIRGWLDTHPDEVVTVLLVNSDNADAPTLRQQFQSADAEKYAFTPPSQTVTKDWPTLNEMIDNNKRLVVFVANLPPSSNTVAPYLLDEFSHVFENNYDISDPNKFDCTVDRPSGLRDRDVKDVVNSGYMSLMNHMLYNRIGEISFPADNKVESTNAAGGRPGNLGDHANACTSAYGRPPNYLLVDFFNVGRSIETVDRLNGVTGRTSGRANLPDTVAGSIFDGLT